MSMLLWLVLTVMISATAAALAVALVRRQDERRDRPGEAAALRSELADLDAQVTAGVLPSATGESLRAETIRRFIGARAADPTPSAPLGRRTQMGLAVVVAAAVALGAALLYGALGRPDLGAGAPPSAPPAASQASEVAALLPQLEAKVRANPGDQTGLRLLGGAYLGLGRYGEAAGIFHRLAALAPRDVDSRSAEGQALTQAAGGTVTPEASAAFRAALALDPADPRARYYLALQKDQDGDHEGAMSDWIALLKSAPAGAPWAAGVRGQIEQRAAELHEDISGRLPPEPEAAEAPPVQPPMIRSMVEGLDARLRAQPKDRQGWIMLMRARMVLHEAPAAQDAYRRGLAAFSGSPADQAQLAAAARALGIPQS
jgi:cytochrome c-type biogenesis protein CcmH